MTPAFAQPTLRLTESQYATILGNCYDGLPNEACGILVGPFGGNLEPTGQVSAALPAANVDASAITYTIDPRDILKAGRLAEANRDEIVGVWHSHTHTDPYPSPTDVAKAVDPAWLYVIVSLRDLTPMLRAYRIRDGVIAEVAVELDRG
jgi:[CysO sulfur-carrier protein]-S-L-cysteine hydrolase